MPFTLTLKLRGTAPVCSAYLSEIHIIQIVLQCPHVQTLFFISWYANLVYHNSVAPENGYFDLAFHFNKMIRFPETGIQSRFAMDQSFQVIFMVNHLDNYFLTHCFNHLTESVNFDLRTILVTKLTQYTDITNSSDKEMCQDDH
ncbi:MAG: hypothetical protein CSB48_14000 [Proteobacteria bacterium]|nr:MAG: hypothetical protein CSB48_14000 [Pseudomonadota bacterium]